MSYVDNKDNENKEEKSGSIIKAMFVDNEVEETPEDVIEKDADINRKNAFNKAYARLQDLCPEIGDKKKKKKKEKEREKEEFNRNLSARVREQADKQQEVSSESNTKENDRTKGRERE